MTQTRSTTASPTDSNPSTTLVLTGVATAAICFPSVVRTHGVAQNAISPATPTARTLSPTFAACRWRLRTCSSRRPAKSPGARRSRSGARRHKHRLAPRRNSNTPRHLRKYICRSSRWSRCRWRKASNSRWATTATCARPPSWSNLRKILGCSKACHMDSTLSSLPLVVQAVKRRRRSLPSRTSNKCQGESPCRLATTYRLRRRTPFR